MNKKLKNLLSLAFAFAFVFAILIVVNGASVFAASPNWDTVDTLTTISEDKIISVDDEATDTFTNGLSTNGYIYGGNTAYKNSKSITVDGITYTNALHLKAINSRAIAIKVAGACQIKAYATYNSVRHLGIADSTESTVVALATSSSIDSSYEELIYNYTGTDAKIFYIYADSGSDTYLNMIQVTFGVEAVSVTGVEINSSISDVQVGKTKTLTAKISPADATNNAVNWSSSNESVLTVSSTGVITGVSEGTATVTVTTEDGGYTATVDITVNAAVDLGGVSGSAEDLTAPTVTTTYDFLADGVKTDPTDQSIVFEDGNLYYNNQVYIASGVSYYTGKTTYNIDGTTNSDGMRVKAKQGVFAVKLPVGATVEVPMSSGTGSSRYGVAATSSDVSATTDSSVLAYTENDLATSGNSPQTLSYTNETGAEQVVYITATTDVFFSQVKVTVPEATTYKISQTTADSSNVAVISKSTDNTEFVIIAVISADRAAEINSLKMTNSGANKIFGETNEVYRALSVNDTEYTATDFGGSYSDYLFASKLSVTDATEDISSTIQSNVKIAVE